MGHMLPNIIYYSSRSGNTARFVARLGLPAGRVPISPKDPMPLADRPFVLICPCYADAHGTGAVPKQVIRFLNDETRRAHLLGVIGTGNRNFGASYALAAKIIAEKCKVPVLYRLELAGTDKDVEQVKLGMIRLANETNKNTLQEKLGATIDA